MAETDSVGSNGIPKSRREMITAAGRVCQVLGFPRSAGQVYGLLFLSPKVLSLHDISEQLQLSKGSVSNATRQLQAWGVIRQVWVQGNRREHFEIVEDLGRLLHAGYRDVLKTKLGNSRRRLETIKEDLADECDGGEIEKDEYEFCMERIKKLQAMHERLESLLPLAEKLF